MHFYFVININKIADLSINFEFDHIFKSSYNKKNTRVNKSLLLIV